MARAVPFSRNYLCRMSKTRMNLGQFWVVLGPLYGSHSLIGSANKNTTRLISNSTLINLRDRFRPITTFSFSHTSSIKQKLLACVPESANYKLKTPQRSPTKAHANLVSQKQLGISLKLSYLLKVHLGEAT